MVAQLRGMALAASVSLGRRSFDDLGKNSTPARVFLPDPTSVAVYRHKARELKGLFMLNKKWRRTAARMR
jgi:sugar (pentulose or hexulose) kinase